MPRRTRAMIARDIRTTESNLALAIDDYEYLKGACEGFPALIERLSKELNAFKDEEHRFRAASRQGQIRWKSAGEVQQEVSRLGSSKLLQLATTFK